MRHLLIASKRRRMYVSPISTWKDFAGLSVAYGTTGAGHDGLRFAQLRTTSKELASQPINTAAWGTHEHGASREYTYSNAARTAMSRLALLLLFALPFLVVVSAVKASSNVSRSQFPKGFLFGTASSAYQVSTSS